MHHVAGLQEVEGEQQQVTLRGDAEPGVDPVPMDSGKIGRVLANLIGNVLRYTSPGGTVEIRAWKVIRFGASFNVPPFDNQTSS